MRVGIIGCGQISPVHISSVVKVPGAEVVAVCDLDEGQAQRTARKFGIAAAYQEVDEMLARERPDVVHVLTPPATHTPLAIQGMNAGCHVLVEKPLALCLADADGMISVARQTGKRLCVDHSRMFDPLVLEAKRYLSEPAFGRLVGVEYFQGFPARPVSLNPADNLKNLESSWLSDLDLGVIQDLAPHALAFLLEFLGAPEIFHLVAQPAIAAPTSAHPPQCQEIKMLAAGAGGMGSFTISLGSRPFMCWLTLYGSGMALEIDFNYRTLVKKRERNFPSSLKRGLSCVEESLQLLFGTARNAGRLLLRNFARYPGIDELIQRFYDSLRSGSEMPVSLEQGREVVRLMDRMAEDSRKEMLCAS